MNRTVSLLFALLLFQGTLYAKGYRITVKLDNAREKQVLLAHYYGPNIYVDDTINTDASGSGIFSRDTLLPQGLYKIYLDKENHFDFLLGADQVMTIKNPGFAVEGLEIEGARESVEFLEYMKWLRGKQEEKTRLDTAAVKAGPDEKKRMEKQISDINEEVSDYWLRKDKQFPGTMLARFLMANYFKDVKPEEIPAEYALNDSLKWIYQYNIRKNHFFDNFDFSDPRLLYTPLVQSKLETYFDKILVQYYDSVKPAAYQVIARTEKCPPMYRYVVSFLLNHAIASKIMGMDALFVDLARDYYLSGKTNWADSTTLAKIRENVIFMEQNLIGKKAPDIRMETIDGQPFRLYQLTGKYIVLAFFEPGCSHCKEYMPRLYKEIYLPFRDKGLEVVAGYTMNNRKEWEDFLTASQMNDWMNVWDQYHLSRFKIIYDTRTTPSVYLLDKDKTIVAKKVSIEFLKDYLEFYLENKEK